MGVCLGLDMATEEIAKDLHLEESPTLSARPSILAYLAVRLSQAAYKLQKTTSDLLGQ